jgi:hypothetical protein
VFMLSSQTYLIEAPTLPAIIAIANSGRLASDVLS